MVKIYASIPKYEEDVREKININLYNTTISKQINQHNCIQKGSYY